MPDFTLERFLPYRLNKAASAVSEAFKAVYGPHYDLTIPEWRVLATIAEFGQVGAKAIGRHSSMHKTKVSRAVTALEERRWLRRRASASDRREEILILTPLGTKVFKEIVPRALAFEQSLLSALGSADSVLLSALERLETECAPASTRPRGNRAPGGAGA